MKSTRSPIVGVFSNPQQADRAISELRRAGFNDNEIGIAMRHVEGGAVIPSTEGGTCADSSEVDTAEHDTYAGTGALAGSLAGLGLGALAGVGVLSGVIPVIGPAIAGGTLGVILSNAAAGAGIAGLVGALVGAGVPEHEAQYYQSEFEAGRVIITVNSGDRTDEAMAILRRNGAYDMSTQGVAI